jgi:ATP-dependent helicase/DNAse subunit B
MGFKIDNSLVDAWLSKIEVVIENITSFAVVGNLVVNQLMERKVAVVVTTKVVSAEEPKWTTLMAKNMCQVVSQVVETLINTPK